MFEALALCGAAEQIGAEDAETTQRERGKDRDRSRRDTSVDADPEDLPFGVVDGEEWCAATQISTLKALLRALACSVRAIRVSLLPFAL